MTKQTLLARILIIFCVVAVVIGVGNTVSSRNQIDTAKSTLTGLQNSQRQALADLTVPSIQPRIIPHSDPAIYAKAYIALHPDTQYPLIQKNADLSVPIASTTKIMTALIALERYSLDRVITIPREAAAIEGSEIQLMTNETMTVSDLLYALLIKSANDAAMTLAMADGNKEDFVADMNRKAALLGMRNTHYKDPAGLNDEGRSTAHDLAILARYALTHEVFRTIVQTPTYTVWSADRRYMHELTSNSNRLVVPQEALYLPGAIGIKTGYTEGAGHCLVAALKTDDNKIIVAVILHTTESTNSASAKEARKLLVWAQQLLKKT